MNDCWKKRKSLEDVLFTFIRCTRIAVKCSLGVFIIFSRDGCRNYAKDKLNLRITLNFYTLSIWSKQFAGIYEYAEYP